MASKRNFSLVLLSLALFTSMFCISNRTAFAGDDEEKDKMLAVSSMLREGVRPDIKRHFDYQGAEGTDKIYRVEVKIHHNADDHNLASIQVPFSQDTWQFSKPSTVKWQKTEYSFDDPDIDCSKWKSEWKNVSVYWKTSSTDDEVKKCKTITIVFYAKVDAATSLSNTTSVIRLRYDWYVFQDIQWINYVSDFWQSNLDFVCVKQGSKSTQHCYTYTGDSNMLVFYDLVNASNPIAPQGWTVFSWSEDSIVFTGSGSGDFCFDSQDSIGVTGLIRWRDNSEYMNTGYLSGPGTASYPCSGGAPIPTMTEWGIIAMVTLLIGSGAWMVIRRRKKSIAQ